MRNAECGIDRATVEPRSELAGSTSALQFRIPHSALRIRGGAGGGGGGFQRVSRGGGRGWGGGDRENGGGVFVPAGVAPPATADTLPWRAGKPVRPRGFAGTAGTMR